MGDVVEQRRLAAARLAGQQHDLPGDQPAAQHPVELREAGELARHALLDDLRERASHAADYLSGVITE